MTVLKTVLVAALLLLAAAAAAQTPRNYTIYNYTIFIVDSHDHGEDLDIYALQSVGPYDYDPYSTVYYYLLWFPPHAVPMNLRFLNVTWWKPETIWLVGTYPVEVVGMGYVPATIYVVQDGVRMNLHRLPHIFAALVEWHVRHICALGVAMVVPNKIIVLNLTTQL
jgi:hypothetical protein